MSDMEKTNELKEIIDMILSGDCPPGRYVQDESCIGELTCEICFREWWKSNKDNY